MIEIQNFSVYGWNIIKLKIDREKSPIRSVIKFIHVIELWATAI